MILKVFSTYDSKAEAFLKPFFMHSTGEAVRGFAQAVVDPNSMFSKFPGDFTLFELGSYDDQTGSFTFLEARRNLGTALEHLPKSPHQEALPFPKAINQ